MNAYLYAYVSVNYLLATLPTVFFRRKNISREKKKRAIYYSRELKMTQHRIIVSYTFSFAFCFSNEADEKKKREKKKYHRHAHREREREIEGEGSTPFPGLRHFFRFFCFFRRKRFSLPLSPYPPPLLFPVSCSRLYRADDDSEKKGVRGAGRNRRCVNVQPMVFISGRIHPRNKGYAEGIN